jgi:hypothetical protein
VGNIVIGYDNLIDDPAVTITSSTEAGDFVKEMVRVWDPREVFRTTVLNPGWIKFSGLRRKYDLLALIGTSLTKHRNQIRYANELDNPAWVATGIPSVLRSSLFADPYGGRRAWKLTENTANSQHYLEQTITIKEPVEGEAAYTVYFKKDTGRNLWIYFDYTGAGGDSDQAIISTTTGAVLSGTATVTEITVSGLVWYKVTINGAANSPAKDTLRVRIGLASGTSTTYTGTSNVIYVYAAQYESLRGTGISGTGSPPALNGADTGPLVLVNSDSGAQVGDWAQHPFDQDMQDRPTTDFYHRLTNEPRDHAIEFQLHDDDNTDGAIDVGRVFIGPTWQPSNYNLDQWGVEIQRSSARVQRTEGSDYRPAHRRMPNRWSIRIPHATKAEALADREDLLIKTLSLSKPVVAILDPDATEHRQQQVLYGFMDNLRVDFAFNNAAQEHFFNLAFDIEEFT